MICPLEEPHHGCQPVGLGCSSGYPAGERTWLLIRVSHHFETSGPLSVSAALGDFAGWAFNLDSIVQRHMIDVHQSAGRSHKCCHGKRSSSDLIQKQTEAVDALEVFGTSTVP